ncbi:MAG: retropepsin-like aspartic protease [Cyanobacteria bacterium]|nr:retropepsin-like aspartic protease [Cyanobacteriota bacterium]
MSPSRLVTFAARTVTVVLGISLGGCALIRSPEPQSASTPTVVSTSVAISTPVAAPIPEPEPSSRINFFQEGVNQAQSAVAIGQSAQSEDDWNLAANRWQQAVNYMKQVPDSDTNHATAQQKAKEYQQNLTLAQKRAQGEVAAANAANQERAANAPDENGRVARIPIVERRGGTPLVSVSLAAEGGSQRFNMLFDTGATVTLITEAMARAIGFKAAGQATVTVADGRQVALPIGYIDIEVGGLVKRNVLVAVGGDAGLLGQDVYGEYGLSVGGAVIDLYQ